MPRGIAVLHPGEEYPYAFCASPERIAKASLTVSEQHCAKCYHRTIVHVTAPQGASGLVRSIVTRSSLIVTSWSRSTFAINWESDGPASSQSCFSASE